MMSPGIFTLLPMNHPGNAHDSILRAQLAQGIPGMALHQIQHAAFLIFVKDGHDEFLLPIHAHVQLRADGSVDLGLVAREHGQDLRIIGGTVEQLVSLERAQIGICGVASVIGIHLLPQKALELIQISDEMDVQPFRPAIPDSCRSPM